MHLYLVGYRGTGKSTVGKLLAVRLRRALIDTDDVIESIAGMSIREIFATEGEQGFRDREQRVIADVANESLGMIVALGGGAVLREANQEALQHSGQVVWLQGSPSALFARMQADASSTERRPRLSQLSGYDEIVEILAQREPIYGQLADLTICTDQRTPDDIVAEIADWADSASN